MPRSLAAVVFIPAMTNVTGAGQIERMQSISVPPSPESLLCAVLRGQVPRWPAEASGDFVATFTERALFHGVLGLVHDSLRRMPMAAFGWPMEVLRDCRDVALAQAMWELRHRERLQPWF